MEKQADEPIERLLGYLKVLLMLLVVIATVVPILVGYWIVGENARAIKRWESIQFESAVQRVPDRDVQRLSRRMEELSSDLRELEISVNRLLVMLEKDP